MDIELILAKIESLKDILKEQFETKVSWTKVAAMKHKKYSHIEQRVENTFPLPLNRYILLRNDSEGDDTLVSTERLRLVNSKQVWKDRMIIKRECWKRNNTKLLSSGIVTQEGVMPK